MGGKDMSGKNLKKNCRESRRDSVGSQEERWSIIPTHGPIGNLNRRLCGADDVGG